MGPLEEIAHRLFGCSDIFVQNLGAFDADKVQIAFACHSTGEERFPTPWVAIEEDAATQPKGRRLEDWGIFRWVHKCFEEGVACSREATNFAERSTAVSESDVAQRGGSEAFQSRGEVSLCKGKGAFF